MKNWKAMVTGATILGLTSVAAAQDLPVAEGGGLDRTVGAFAVVLPDYEGSDDYTFAPAPLLRYKFSEERYVQIFGNKAFVNILNHPNFEFGPKAVYRFGRDDPDDSVVDLMKDVDDSFELGGFVGYKMNFDSNPRHRMNVHLDLTQDVSDGHDGYVAELSGVYWRPAATSFDIGFRGNVSYASDDYMSSFFSVTTSDSVASGLSTFDADAGFKDIGVAALGLYHLNQTWHIGGVVMYKRLLGDAEDSPVVSDRGSENQLFVGLGLLYSW